MSPSMMFPLHSVSSSTLWHHHQPYTGADCVFIISFDSYIQHGYNNILVVETILKMMIPREVAEVPDLVGRATPWMVALILIEAGINHFHRWGQLLPGGDGGGKLVLQMLMPNVILGRRSKTLPTAWPGKNVRWKEARFLKLMENATSISFGLLMTLAGLASKFMMIDIYDNVHKNYQMVKTEVNHDMWGDLDVKNDDHVPLRLILGGILHQPGFWLRSYSTLATMLSTGPAMRSGS